MEEEEEEYKDELDDLLDEADDEDDDDDIDVCITKIRSESDLYTFDEVDYVAD